MGLEMEDFSLQLRKINAIKIYHEKDESKIEVSKEEKTKRLLHEVGIHIKKKDIQDKKLQLKVIYRVPSASESNVEIDAEFIGSISLNEPLDNKGEEDFEKSPRFKEFLDKILTPKIFKELDNILSPLYNSMNVEYQSMYKKIGEDACEIEYPS